MTREEWARAHGASAAGPRRGPGVRRALRPDRHRGRPRPARRSPARPAPGVAAAAFGARMEGQFAPAEGAPGYRGRRGPLTVAADLKDVVDGRLRHRRPPAGARRRCDFAAAAGDVVHAGPDRRGVRVPGRGDRPRARRWGSSSSAAASAEPTCRRTSRVSGSRRRASPRSASTAAQNAPGVDQNADGEVMLDIEVVGAVAPGATIAVYFAPNTDQGFIDALSTAVHDTTHAPSVVSISWGQSEDVWSAQARAQMEQILTEAAGMGVTVTVAAGDNGSTDNVSDGHQHVDFPGVGAARARLWRHVAAALRGGQISVRDACGTTRATAPPAAASAASSRCRATSHRPRCPTTSTPGRRAAASPTSAATPTRRPATRSASTASNETIGGTSAVAPLWAGLIARLNESAGGAAGLRPAAAVSAAGHRRLPRHQPGKQRLLRGRPRLGRLHRAGLAGRDRAGIGAAGARGWGGAVNRTPPGAERRR